MLRRSIKVVGYMFMGAVVYIALLLLQTFFDPALDAVAHWLVLLPQEIFILSVLVGWPLLASMHAGGLAFALYRRGVSMAWPAIIVIITTAADFAVARYLFWRGMLG